MSEPTKVSMPEIRWSAIRGMRNRLIHAYYAIDLETVWRTTTEDLPVIIERLDRELPN